MYKFHIRLYGIDSCELKSKIHSNKDLAVQARDRMVELCAGGAAIPNAFVSRKDIRAFLDEHVSLVYLECMDTDKYGRTLANIYNPNCRQRSFSEILVEEKLAQKL